MIVWYTYFSICPSHDSFASTRQRERSEEGRGGEDEEGRGGLVTDPGPAGEHGHQRHQCPPHGHAETHEENRGLGSSS